ncbi:MAG: DUF1971 domain-containing protein [Gammaproteobacteria bacterium]
MKSIPDNAVAYRRTAEFNEENVPEIWLRPHSTKRGRWAKIIVLDGRLGYVMNGTPPEEVSLDPEHHGVVEPGVGHFIKPLGKVRFYLEFYREK